MAIEIIGVGSAPNDGTGDPLRTAYIKCNSNFGELYSRAQPSIPGSLVGSIGDQAGMYAYDATYFYYCFQDYDGSSEIWAEVTNVGNIAIPGIINGTSSIQIGAPNSNITVSVSGTSNVAVFSNVGVTTNNLTVLGNTTAGNIVPQADAVYNLGTANTRWQSLYVGNLVTQQLVYANSEIGISGDDGNVTISVDGTSNVAVFGNSIAEFSNVAVLDQVEIFGNTFTGNIVPLSDLAFNLGSPGNRWQSLYVAGNGLFVGNSEIIANNYTITLITPQGGEFSFSGDSVANATGFFGNVTASNVVTANLLLSTDANITGNVDIVGTLNTAGNATMGHVVPAANSVYDLGSPTNQWRSLYVSGNTIYLGSSEITADDTSITLSTSSGAEFTISGNSAANTVGSFGDVEVSGNVSGNLIIANSITAAETITATGNIQTSGLFIGTLLGNVTGNFVIPGSTTQVIYNSDGLADASPDFTYNNISKLLTVQGNIAANSISSSGSVSVTGNISAGNLSTTSISGTLTTAAQPNITSTGTLTSLAVTGNITSGNVSGTTGTFVNLLGNGSALTAINASNIASGTLSAAQLSGTYTITVSGAATTAGTVTTAAQPNITSTGTLTSLAVTGNVTSGNVSGTNVTGTLTTAAQPNITSTGTLTSLAVTGNITSGNVSGTSIAGTLTTAAQPNITSVGTLSSLAVTGNVVSANIVASSTVFAPSITKTGSNGTGNIGSSTNYFNQIFATATSAQYADLAELYTADAKYESGTVVCFRGTDEITVCNIDADPMIAGVISTNPAYIMNSGLNSQYVATVALAGRVPCRVRGPVRRGQMMVSAGDGQARAELKPEMGTVIGKALEDFSGESGIIEIVVGRI